MAHSLTPHFRCARSDARPAAVGGPRAASGVAQTTTKPDRSTAALVPPTSRRAQSGRGTVRGGGLAPSFPGACGQSAQVRRWSRRAPEEVVEQIEVGLAAVRLVERMRTPRVWLG